MKNKKIIICKKCNKEMDFTGSQQTMFLLGKDLKDKVSFPEEGEKVFFDLYECLRCGNTNSISSIKKIDDYKKKMDEMDFLLKKKITNILMSISRVKSFCKSLREDAIENNMEIHEILSGLSYIENHLLNKFKYIEDL